MRRGAAVVVLWAAMVVAIGFFVGRSLRPESGATYAFDAGAAAYQAPGTSAGRSQGGFTGFAEGADGRTVISGRAVSITADSITLETAAGTTTVRVSGASSVRRLEPSERAAIRTGAQLIVRRDGNNASGVLVVAAP